MDKLVVVLLERFVNGRARSNAYVYLPDGAARALIIDPGVGAAEKILEFMKGHALEPAAVLLTHGHPDHVWTLRHLADRLDTVSYLHGEDAGWLDDPATGGTIPVIRAGGRLVGRLRRLRPQKLAHVTDDDSLEIEGMTIRVLHTPGHTLGSVCFVTERVCFAGDTVFNGGLGHTTYPGGSKQALRESIRTRLLPLPDDIRLLPGHGKGSSVGDERALWERET